MKYKKGKENIVADALSRKMILIAKLEINVLGLDKIKDLYASDPTFGPIFAKCSCDKGDVGLGPIFTDLRRNGKEHEEHGG